MSATSQTPRFFIIDKASSSSSDPCSIERTPALIAIFGVNASMILFGWLQERMNPPGRTSTTMMPFWFGTVAGVMPWVAIWFNVIGAEEVPAPAGWQVLRGEVLLGVVVRRDDRREDPRRGDGDEQDAADGEVLFVHGENGRKN